MNEQRAFSFSRTTIIIFVLVLLIFSGVIWFLIIVEAEGYETNKQTSTVLERYYRQYTFNPNTILDELMSEEENPFILVADPPISDIDYSHNLLSSDYYQISQALIDDFIFVPGSNFGFGGFSFSMDCDGVLDNNKKYPVFITYYEYLPSSNSEFDWVEYSYEIYIDPYLGYIEVWEYKRLSMEYRSVTNYANINMSLEESLALSQPLISEWSQLKICDHISSANFNSLNFNWKINYYSMDSKNTDIQVIVDGETGEILEVNRYYP